MIVDTRDVPLVRTLGVLVSLALADVISIVVFMVPLAANMSKPLVHRAVRDHVLVVRYTHTLLNRLREPICKLIIADTWTSEVHEPHIL